MTKRAPIDPITAFINETGSRVIDKTQIDREEGEAPWTNEELAVVYEYIKCLAYSGNANPTSLPGVNITDLSSKRRGQIRLRFVSVYLDRKDELTGCYLPFGNEDWFLERLLKEIKERADKLEAKSAKAR